MWHQFPPPGSTASAVEFRALVAAVSLHAGANHIMTPRNMETDPVFIRLSPSPSVRDGQMNADHRAWENRPPRTGEPRQGVVISQGVEHQPREPKRTILAMGETGQSYPPET